MFINSELVDENGNRYITDENDKLEKITPVSNNLLDVCYEYGSLNKKLLLNILEKSKRYRQYDRIMIDLFKNVSMLSGLKEKTKNDNTLSLVNYYYDNFQGELLEMYLISLAPNHGIQFAYYGINDFKRPLRQCA